MHTAVVETSPLPSGDPPLVPQQTNLGLYAQLHTAGHSSDDICRVQEAYALATQLFSGVYRGNGKPFVCHLVGTASIVAQIDRRIAPILAALLHAAFQNGVFPTGRRGPTQKHREFLAQRAGADVAALVAGYHDFDFSSEGIERLLRAPPSSEPATTMLILRLANEVDDLTDERFAASAKRSSLITSAQHCAKLARQIGREGLAITIESLAAEQCIMALTEHDSSKSYRLIPRFGAYLRLWRKSQRQSSLRLIE